MVSPSCVDKRDLVSKCSQSGWSKQEARVWCNKTSEQEASLKTTFPQWSRFWPETAPRKERPAFCRLNPPSSPAPVTGPSKPSSPAKTL